MDAPALLTVLDRDESLPTRRIPNERKSFRVRPTLMRLSRFRRGTCSLTRESYRFPNKCPTPAIARYLRLFIFGASKANLTAPDVALCKAGITSFSRRIVVTTSLTASANQRHARFVSCSSAVHLAADPEQKLVATMPFVTAEIHDDKATTSCSFRLDRANFKNCAALVTLRKALAAIKHKW